MTTYTKPYPGFREKTREEMLAEAESTRHLPGKHDQKSHAGGKGRISAEAVQARVAEITAEYGGRAAAAAERGTALEDAALFDLAGYSGTPTVLSPAEFEAYEGAEVPYGIGGVERSTFARGFRSGPDGLEGGKAARDMVYDDAYFVGNGVFTNGLYIGSPDTANFFAQVRPPGYDDLSDQGGIEDLLGSTVVGPPPPAHSVDAGRAGYVRVKLKPGTVVVHWDDLDTMEYTPDNPFMQMPHTRPSHEINMQAINEHGAQVINTSQRNDTLSGIVVLDRSALVVEQFVEPEDAYDQGPALVDVAEQGLRSETPYGLGLADQSRALALLVNDDPTVRPRVIESGWAGLTEEEADRCARLFADRYDGSGRSQRHLPGKHDQKSHGKGGGSGSAPITVEAIADRRAEILDEAGAFLDRIWSEGGSMDEAFSVGTKDPYMFAMQRRGMDLGAAAALDLLGYSEEPTVLSSEEFDAFEGAKVRLPYRYDFGLEADFTSTEPFIVEEFGRATGSRESAENMVYGDTHFVGTGVAGPGTYIGQPTVAAQFAGGLYSTNPSHIKTAFAELGRPPDQSTSTPSESYTRVKLKPGTKIVTESEVREALARQFDAEQAEWERTGDPDSGRYTALDDAEGRGVSRMVFAAERMGAQAILAQDPVDPLRGLVVLDRQALVFDGDFVDPDEAWRSAIRAAAAMAVDDLVRQSRGLALLMRLDRDVERRILDGGQWNDLSDAEQARAVELYELRYGPSPEKFYTLLVDESKRHLPGKHDQKSHGRGGPAVAAGDTWDEVSANMGFMPMRPQEAFPERYAPNKAYGVHLKEGEVETRLRTDDQGKPVMVDFTPMPIQDYLARQDEVDAAGFVEPGDRMTHILVEAGRRPPEHTFRAVAEDDYQRMVAQGHLDTDGRMNLAQHEGMVTEVGDPSWYLPNPAPDANGDRIGVGPPGRIVRIRYDESDGWWRDRDGYIKTPQAVPFDRVDLVSPVLRKSPDAPGGREVMRAESLRHLAGQHDQKSHGKKGAGFGKGGAVGTVDDGLPDGWAMRPLAGGAWESTAIVSKDGTQTSVQIDSMAFLRTPGDWSKFRPEAERLAIAERAAIAVARSIDPLYAKHPELRDVDLRITVDTHGGILKPGTAAHMDTLNVVGKDGSLQTGVSIVVQPSLFAPRPGETPFEAADTSVMGDHKLGHTAMAMTASAEDLHGDMAAAAPVRSTIVHEMGHVVDWASADNPDDPNWHEQSPSLATKVFSDGSRIMDHYDTASEYARTSATEFFAEAFAEWHLRDVAEPSDAARYVAEKFGWE